MNKALIKKFLLILIVTRVVYTLVGVYAREHYLDKTKPFPSWTYNSRIQALNVWTSWDSGFYKTIAETGYPQVTETRSKAIIDVPAKSWVKVFLGYGLVGPDKLALPVTAGTTFNNNLFIIGATDRDTQVELNGVGSGLPYCIYKGPIVYERDVKIAAEALLPQSTACLGQPCDKSYLTYFSSDKQSILYQEYFDKFSTEIPIRGEGGVRPEGFLDEPFQGLGCKTLSETQLLPVKNLDVEKTISPFPFMPLYPYLTKLLALLLRDTVLAGLVLSNLAFFASALLFYKLLTLDFSEKFAYRAAVAYIFYPLTFLSSAMLSEGLYNFLLFLTLYLVRVRRYQASAVAFALLSITRVTGLFAIAPLVYFIYFQEKDRLETLSKSLIYTLSFIPLLLHLTNVFRKTGDFLVMYTAQKGFGRGGDGIFANFIRYFLGTNKYGDFEFVVLILAVFLAVTALVFLYREKKISFIPYSIITAYNLLLPLSTGMITSFPRYSLGIFPVFIGLGLLVKDERKFSWLMAICFFISLIFMSLWTISSRYVM